MTSSTRTTKLFSALAVGLAVFSLVAGLRMTRWFEVIELKALDHLVRRYADPAPGGFQSAVAGHRRIEPGGVRAVALAARSIRYVVRYLKQAGAKAVVRCDVFEPMRMPRSLISRLQDDMHAADNVFLPMLFLAESRLDTDGSPIPRNAESRVAGIGSHGGHASRDQTADPSTGAAGAWTGVINLSADADGPTRRIQCWGNWAAIRPAPFGRSGSVLARSGQDFRQGRTGMDREHQCSTRCRRPTPDPVARFAGADVPCPEVSIGAVLQASRSTAERGTANSGCDVVQRQGRVYRRDGRRSVRSSGDAIFLPPRPVC